MLDDLSYINCRDLLESTGIKNISESNGEISFSCPSADHFHGDTSPSARMNSRTSLWLCHSCGMKGTGITFLAWHKSIPETVARRLIEERYGGGAISAGVGDLEQAVKRIMNPEKIVEQERIPPAESWLKTFYFDWSIPYMESNIVKYMFDRNFTSAKLFEWQIGYDKLSDRITIPIKDHEGKLVGFKGRAWRENTIPRYMILGDNSNQTRYEFQPYQKSHYIFGLDRFVHENRRAGCDYVVIVEGELNAIAMDQYGFYSVSIAGSEFSDIQLNLLKTWCSDAVIYLDNDKAGNKGTRKVVEMLSPYMGSLNVVQNAPGDAAELDKDAVRNLIDSAQPYLTLKVEGKI